MSNELKPVAYMMDESYNKKFYEADDLIGDNGFEHLEEEIKDGVIIPLYAIPDGYQIVSIDPEQQLRDNLERHNNLVRISRGRYEDQTAEDLS